MRLRSTQEKFDDDDDENGVGFRLGSIRAQLEGIGGRFQIIYAFL